MKNIHRRILLIACCLWPIIATAQQSENTETILSQDQLRDRINERSNHPKFQKDSKLLFNQVTDLLILVDSLDTAILRLEDVLRIKDNEIAAINDSISPLEWITSPTISIFESPMPKRNLIPLPLQKHYDMITNVRDLATQMNNIDNLVQSGNNIYSEKSDEERKKAIATLIGPLMDKYYDQLSSLLLSQPDTLTPSQQEFITDKIQKPYNQYYNTYF